MANNEPTESDKSVYMIFVYFVVGLLFVGIPVLLIAVPLGIYVPKSVPVIFIVIGVLMFCVPGLFRNDPSQPRSPLGNFADSCYQLIQDEDPETPAQISLAKFQMLFWTVVLATSYCWLLLAQSGQEEPKAPDIPNAWLVLMGISSGTYVLAKTANSLKKGRPPAKPATDKPESEATASPETKTDESKKEKIEKAKGE